MSIATVSCKGFSLDTVSVWRRRRTTFIDFWYRGLAVDDGEWHFVQVVRRPLRPARYYVDGLAVGWWRAHWTGLHKIVRIKRSTPCAGKNPV